MAQHVEEKGKETACSYTDAVIFSPKFIDEEIGIMQVGHTSLVFMNPFFSLCLFRSFCDLFCYV